MHQAGRRKTLTVSRGGHRLTGCFKPATMALTTNNKENAMSISMILLIVLILILIGVLPTWGHSSSWGYGPSGGVGLVVLILVILLVMGRI